MVAGGKAFGPLAWLRLPPGLTGVTPPQSGWRWQAGAAGTESPAPTKGPFSAGWEEASPC